MRSVQALSIRRLRLVCMGLLLIWVSGVSLQVAAAEDEANQQSRKPVARFEATFASAGSQVPACSELPLKFQGQVARLLPDPVKPQLQAAEQAFDKQLLSLPGLQKDLEKSRDAVRVAVLGVLRLVEESSSSLAADYQRADYLKSLWHAAQFKYHLDKAEQEVLDALIDYYWRLWSVVSAEEEMRKAVTSYYATVESIYPVLESGPRSEALSFFRERLGCLTARRELVFCTLARDRRNFWKNLNQRAWSTVVGDEAWAGVDDLEPECGQPATVTDAAKDPMAELADSFLSSLRLEEEYARLAPETTTTIDVFSTLLTREEDALRNGELNELIDEAMQSGFEREAAEWLAYNPLSDASRTVVFRMRAERAQLVNEKKLLALEAAYRKKTSVILGLLEAFTKAWKQGVITSEGVATAEAMKGFEPTLKSLALVAITQKLLGDSLSLMVTTPIQDALIEVAFKPAWGLFGEEVKTSVDKEWDQHLQQIADFKRKKALLTDLTEQIGNPSGAAPYLTAFTEGNPLATPIGRRAPTTVRALLEDADFISATKGGLAWVFEPFCELESQCSAVLLQAAATEMGANARLGAVRVAAMRGLTVENPDLKLTRASLEEIVKAGQPAPAAVGSFDQLMNCLPLVGDLWRVYNLPSTVRQSIEYLKGNIQNQDDYLQALLDQQQSLRLVISALENVKFDFDRLAKEWPDIYATDHVSLLSGSSEYATAYARIRHRAAELEKRLVVARHRDPARRGLTSQGQTLLTAVQSRQDVEAADLGARAGYSKLVYYALTGNYEAAAVQTKNLESLEGLRRKELGIKPATVDLSNVVHAFEAEAARGEWVQVYTGLYQSAIKDTVLSLATNALSDSIMASITDRVGLRFALDAPDVDVGAKLYEQLNPWASLFSTEGVFNTLQNGLEGAAKSSTAQILASKQHLLTEGEIEGAIDLVYSVTRDVSQNVRERVTDGTPENVLERAEAEALVAAVTQKISEHDSYYQDEIEPLLRRLEQIGDDPDFDFQREQIVLQIAEKEASPRLVQLREELAALTADANLSDERRLAAEEEVEEAAVQIGAKVVEVEARRRAAEADEGSSQEKAAARAAATAEALSRLKSESVGVEDIRRLVDENDPAQMSRHLLSPELDIGTIRTALKRAKKNHPDRLEEIRALETSLDDRRIELVQNMINEFMATSGLSSQVVAIVQGGAAEGNPEYQGIYGDIDFTIFVVPGVSDNDVKEQILAFFTERDFPLATLEVKSPMDTETFVQPVGRLDAATTPFRQLILDAAVKRKDATRFYSEGGGKWAMNNYAFSGKPLWGNIAEIRKWARAEPREGYGLALDMSRHLGFLTDPRNTPESLARMTPERRMEQLNGILKDSKYFLRLVDAYLMGHDGLGNAMYNNRMQWRQDKGPDASYHAQIAKDVEALVRPGGGDHAERLQAVSGGLEGEALEAARRSIFTEADLPFVQLLAGMKQKGDNPDPWALLDGGTPEAKAASAEALAAWMQDVGPRILAETAAVWQRDHERARNSGDEAAIRAARTDAQRIATTMAAFHIYDAVGAKPMLRPPARVEERLDENGNRRLVDIQVSPEEHLAELRRGIASERERRQRLLNEIEEKRNAIWLSHPPADEMTDEERASVQAELKAVFEQVMGRAELDDLDNPGPWMMFWLRR